MPADTLNFFTKMMEIQKIEALAEHRGEFDEKMTVTNDMHVDPGLGR